MDRPGFWGLYCGGRDGGDVAAMVGHRRWLLLERVVGCAMAAGMRTDLVRGRHRAWSCTAAPTRRRSRSSTRDRGGQYTWRRFAQHPGHHGIRPSVGRTGVCRDNARAQILQRHPGRTNASTPVVHHHTGKAINSCCPVDRDRPCNHTRHPLGTGVPHPGRGRTRTEKPETNSLRPPKPQSEKHRALQVLNK